jgi:hypothetical protein
MPPASGCYQTVNTADAAIRPSVACPSMRKVEMFKNTLMPPRGSLHAKRAALIAADLLPLQNLHHRLLDEAIQYGCGPQSREVAPQLKNLTLLFGGHSPHNLSLEGREATPSRSIPAASRTSREWDLGGSISQYQRRAESSERPSQGTLSVRQVCEKYGVSRWVVHYWIGRGIVPPTRTGIACSNCRDRRRRLYSTGYSALEIHVLLASPLVRAFSHRFRLGLSVDSTFRYGVPH